MTVIQTLPWQCALAIVALFPLAPIPCSYRLEVPARAKVGFPREYQPGAVETRFQAGLSLWVVHDGRRIYALRAVCPQEGCRPNWLEIQKQFQCPCCGSAFRKDGVKLRGPAPHALERMAITLARDGQLEVDRGRTFRKESGQWDDPASYVPAERGGSRR